MSKATREVYPGPLEYMHWTSEALVDRVDTKNREAIMKLHWVNWNIISSAPGSTHNHQVWEGGYLEHIRQVNIYAARLYEVMVETGGFNDLPPEEQFELSELLTVTTLHDIEKPFRAQIKDGQILVDDRLGTKEQRSHFKEDLFLSQNIAFTPQQANAMRYVEGMRDADYSPASRVMSPMATLAHAADLLSARVSYGTRLVA